MKPFVLLTPTYELPASRVAPNYIYRLNTSYMEAIDAAGGVQVIGGFCDYAELLRRCDAVLFTGGCDADPVLFGEEKVNDSVEISHERDTIEMEIFREAYAVRLPMLGICRGIQFINIALGGTLWQDIPSQIPGAMQHRGTRHGVHAEDGSFAAECFGTDFRSNSSHHQSVKEPGRGLHITAHAEDGIVEAIEHESLPIYGFQFHPEVMTGAYRPDELPDGEVVFRKFMKIVREA